MKNTDMLLIAGGVIAAVGISYVGYRGLKDIFSIGNIVNTAGDQLNGAITDVGIDEHTQDISEASMATAQVIAQTENAKGGSMEADFNLAAEAVSKELSEYERAYAQYAPLQIYKNPNGAVTGYSEGYQRTMNEYTDVIEAAKEANILSQQLWGYDVFVMAQN